MNEWEWQLLEDRNPTESISIAGVEIRKGDLVRLRPRKAGDIFDLALAGKTAIVESIEQDYDGKEHIAVVLEDDPGKDLGVLRQPGHRFFFTSEEVEPLRRPKKILIAGIGNIFFGDDGFGVEVVRRLSNLPEGVTVKDFGLRVYDLAYALLGGYDATILVDAAARGERPGTLSVIEPEIDDEVPAPALNAHSIDLVNVLRMARSLGTVSQRILLVACEPASLGGEEGHMGLSDEVSAAVEKACRLVEELVGKTLKESIRDELSQ
jgi:hydrogenase maturation protease